MELNFAERLLVNNSARALVQRFYEGPLLRKLGGSTEGLHVLDVGCGRGIGVQLLLQQFGAAHVSGIDMDPKQIGRARKRLAPRFDGRFTLGVSGVEQLPFENETFDAIFDFGMLHHVPVWQQGVAEIRRVLKPRGRFFFEEVTKKALERWLYRTFLEHPAENRFTEALPPTISAAPVRSSARKPRRSSSCLDTRLFRRPNGISGPNRTSLRR